MLRKFDPAERRAEPREPVKAPARLAYGQGLAMWADCVIRDRSASGAKVEIGAVFRLPARVVMTDIQNGVAYDAMVRWRRGDLAGLQFESRHDLRMEVEPRLNEVRATWLALKGGVLMT